MATILRCVAYFAVSREYKKKDLDDVEIVCFQTVTATHVYQWENTNGWEAVEEKSFRHGFKKLPVLYGYRPETYCHKIKTIRVRIEKILSVRLISGQLYDPVAFLPCKA